MTAAGGKWVLVTDGGNGQSKSTLATVRLLAAAGYRPAVTVSAPSSIAAASRWCRRRIPVPPVTTAGYGEVVRDELARWPYVCCLPTSDAALLRLDAPGSELIDKVRLGQLGRSVGLPPPPTRVFASAGALRAAASSIDYPAVVKPTSSRWPARRADSRSDLAAVLPDDGPLIVQPYVADSLVAVGGVIWRGRIVAAVHQRYLRTWPIDCGGACAAETVEPDIELEQQLVRLLAGYDGIFMAQLAGRYLLDLNPRVYGSLPLALAAGVNLVGVLCALLDGADLGAGTARAQPGAFYRWLEGDLRHLAAGVRGRRLPPATLLRALRPRGGAAHGPESLRDVRPMLARLHYAASKRR